MTAAVLLRLPDEASTPHRESFVKSASPRRLPSENPQVADQATALTVSLHKAHNTGVDLSQRMTTILIVHAAPVRYLPPPGASPAAGEHPPPNCTAARRRSPVCNTRPVASDRSLRLRTRVTLFFALIALFAGLVLIGVTYGFARNSLLDERTASAKQQAFDNDAAVADQLDAAIIDPTVSIGSYFENVLRTEPGGFAVLSSTSPTAPATQTDTTHPLADFPDEVVDQTRSGGSGIQYTSIDGDDYATVGVYIRRHGTGYYEAFPAANEDSTLTALLTALGLGGLGTLVIATLFGYSTSRRLLRPLRNVRASCIEHLDRCGQCGDR